MGEGSRESGGGQGPGGPGSRDTRSPLGSAGPGRAAVSWRRAGLLGSDGRQEAHCPRRRTIRVSGAAARGPCQCGGSNAHDWPPGHEAATSFLSCRPGRTPFSLGRLLTSFPSQTPGPGSLRQEARGFCSPAFKVQLRKRQHQPRACRIMGLFLN